MTNLAQLVEQAGPLNYLLAARYIEAVARELADLHAKGVLHRGVRPAAGILNETGQARLRSGNLPQNDGAAGPDLSINDASIVEVADYLAPEQALNTYKADVRADIYSPGCTFYFLLTGHPPFSEGPISERLLKHQVARAPAIIADRPDAPPPLVELCERMMSKNPRDRPPTAGKWRLL